MSDGLAEQVQNLRVTLATHLGECSVHRLNIGHEMKAIKRVLWCLVTTSGAVLLGMVAVLAKNLLHL